MTARATEALILGTIAGWILWDVHAYRVGGVPATESGIIRRWARHPLVPLAVGVLLGHLFACPL